MHIKDMHAVISGGASGMGAATARLLSQLGAKVSLFDLHLDAAKQVATEIGGQAFVCDVTNAESVTTALKQATEKYGPARICVNCAGIVHSRRMVNQQGPMPLDEFSRVINVNLIGTFNLMRLFAAQLIEAVLINEEERGVIVNTASVAAFDGQIGQSAYSASKSAIVGMTLPVARELASFGIRVMTIAPGLVDTPMFASLSDEARAALAASVPFPKRLAKASEFAQLVQQIIENPMLNGEVIRLDGALRMQAK